MTKEDPKIPGLKLISDRVYTKTEEMLAEITASLMDDPQRKLTGYVMVLLTEEGVQAYKSCSDLEMLGGLEWAKQALFEGSDE